MGESSLFPILWAFILPNDTIENCCQKPCRCTVLHSNFLPGYNQVDNHNHLARWKSTVWMINQLGCLSATSSEGAGYKIETICEMGSICLNFGYLFLSPVFLSIAGIHAVTHVLGQGLLRNSFVLI